MAERDAQQELESASAQEEGGLKDAPAEGSRAEDGAPVHDHDNLKKSAKRGALFIIAGYGGAQALRLVGNLILTRLLFQEAFGVMALMATLLAGLELFSDVGIGPSIIQSERRDRAFSDTAWTIQVGRGFAIYGVACALAYPASTFYEEPSLLYLLPLVGLNAIAAGFNSTKLFRLNRDLALGRIELTLVISQAIGLVTMVVWALIDRSIFALVAGSLVTSFSKMLLTHFFLPGTRDRFAWEKKALIELIRFGRWIFLSTVLTFIAGQSDRLVFGRMVDMETLGVYYIGVVIALMPAEALSKLSQQIIFPVYSRVKEATGSFASVFSETRAVLMVVAGWAFAGLIAGGPTAIDLLYDPRYESAGWAVQILSIGSWFHIVGNTYGAALFADGVPKWTTLGSFLKILFMAAFIPLGYVLAEPYGLGFPGAVLGFSLSEVARYVACAEACRQRGMSGFGMDFRLCALVAVSGGTGAALEWFMSEHHVNVILRALVITIYVTVFWLPLAVPRIRAELERRRQARENVEVPEAF